MKVCVYSLKLSLCLNIDDNKSTITTWHEDEFQFDYEKILEKYSGDHSANLEKKIIVARPCVFWNI